MKEGADISPLRDDVRAAFNEPGTYRQLSELSETKQRRQGRRRSPAVVTVEPNQSAPSSHWFPEGSIVIFYARRTSNRAVDFLDAVVTEDDRTIDRIGDQLSSRHPSRGEFELATAIRDAQNAPALFDVRYGGKEIASHLFLPSGHEIDTTVIPFAGGKLAPDQFEVVEYANAEADADPYDYVIVESHPSLTEIESAALETIPSHLSEITIGEAAEITPVVKVAVCAPLVVMGSGSTFHDRLAEVSLSAREVKQVGIRATASELVTRRRQLFQEYGLL